MKENEKNVWKELKNNGSIDRTSEISLKDLANTTNLSIEEVEDALDGLEKARYIDKWDLQDGLSFRLLGKSS